MSEPAPTVTLVHAADVDLDAVVASGSRVLPVPVEGPVAAALAAHLRRWDIPTAELEWRATGDGSTTAPSSDDPPVRRPDAVVVGAGVPEAVGRLAGALCGVKPTSLGVFAADGAGPARSVLILQHPSHTDETELTTALRALAGDDRPFGLLQVHDDGAGRLAVLKALAVSDVPSVDRFSVLSATLAADPAAPPFVDDTGPLRAEWSHERRDVVVVSGHSTPLDGAMGRHAALCSRVGLLGDDAALAGDGRYPCCADGVCFRQPLMGRDPASTSGLVDPATIAAAVLVLSGCNSAALLDGYADAFVSLAHRGQQGVPLVTIGSASLSTEAPELDLALLSLLRHGVPVGRAVREINAVRRSRGHADWVGAAAGPLVVFGNPELRLTGTACPGDDVVQPDGRSMTLHADGARAGCPEATQFLRARVSRRVPYLFWRDRPELAWCRGAVVGVDEPLLHAQVSGTDEPIRLVELDADPFEAVRDAFRAAIATQPLWTRLLLSYQRRLPSAPMAEAAFGVLGPTMVQLEELASALHLERGVVHDEAALRATATAGWRGLADLSSILLGALTEACVGSGTLHQMHWSEASVPMGAERGDGDCACPRRAAVWGQIQEIAGATRVTRQCPCGPTGEDDGRGASTLLEFARDVPAGGALNWSVRAVAAESYAHVHAALMIESHRRDREMVGSTSVLTLAPGAEQQLSLSAVVPDDLTVGVHPAAVLAVVNLVPVVLRRVVQVTAAPAAHA